MQIAGTTINPGERKRVDISIAKLYDLTEMTMTTEVIRSTQAGPVMFISAAMHGDEINGVEICRRLLQKEILNSLKGTLIVVPIINIFGYNSQSRYLPDRRDLNRSFPGSATGSLAARLANIFLSEIVDKCTHGIDLHTAARHKTNLPHIRASLHVPETKRLAQAFGTSVILNSKIREGSLRAAFIERDIRLLVYEGGEALRFDEAAIQSGLDGIISVMKAIKMLDDDEQKPKESFIANDSYWIRATESGALVETKELGSYVQEKELIGVISGPLGIHTTEVYADKPGILIGKTTIPLVNEGDALFHIARFDESVGIQRIIESASSIDPSVDFG